MRPEHTRLMRALWTLFVVNLPALSLGVCVGVFLCQLLH